MFTLDVFKNILATMPLKNSGQCWVAYSGGLDSHVLLHALSQCRIIYPHLNIKAIHIHHGLSPFADAWSDHCAAICQDLGVICLVKKVDVLGVLGNGSLEEVARDLRYQVFAGLMDEEDCVMLAHHQDDLAETFLLQALRGAGPKGLAGMPAIKPFAKGMILRPLLDISRASLRAYAQAEGLIWQEDESNMQNRFDRNYLRNRIFPGLLARFVGSTSALARSAKHCAETNILLIEMAQEDLVHCKGSVAGTLSVSALLRLSLARQKNLLRFWIKELGFLLPTTVKLEQLLLTVLLARKDACPHLIWCGAEVRRYQDNLYIMTPLPEHDPTEIFNWDMQETLLLPGVGQLNSCEEIGKGIHLPLGAYVTVRFRAGGERMHVAGRLGTHPLKKLFQEWGVPPWLRSRVPLIFYGEELVMVVGYASSAHHPDGRGKMVLLECPPSDT
ncbi:MAG: tRNA(Ile)-lysidine synthetase [Gammaproteobacteria bacterium]|nr:tRNA(Ile)-lysidine synthetase [Gammaproteobacteria bacterium]